MIRTRLILVSLICSFLQPAWAIHEVQLPSVSKPAESLVCDDDEEAKRLLAEQKKIEESRKKLFQNIENIDLPWWVPLTGKCADGALLKIQFLDGGEKLLTSSTFMESGTGQKSAIESPLRLWSTTPVKAQSLDSPAKKDKKKSKKESPVEEKPNYLLVNSGNIGITWMESLEGDSQGSRRVFRPYFDHRSSLLSYFEEEQALAIETVPGRVKVQEKIESLKSAGNLNEEALNAFFSEVEIYAPTAKLKAYRRSGIKDAWTLHSVQSPFDPSSSPIEQKVDLVPGSQEEYWQLMQDHQFFKEGDKNSTVRFDHRGMKTVVKPSGSYFAYSEDGLEQYDLKLKQGRAKQYLPELVKGTKAEIESSMTFHRFKNGQIIQQVLEKYFYRVHPDLRTEVLTPSKEMKLNPLLFSKDSPYAFFSVFNKPEEKEPLVYRSEEEILKTESPKIRIYNFSSTKKPYRDLEWKDLREKIKAVAPKIKFNPYLSASNYLKFEPLDSDPQFLYLHFPADETGDGKDLVAKVDLSTLNVERVAFKDTTHIAYSVASRLATDSKYMIFSRTDSALARDKFFNRRNPVPDHTTVEIFSMKDAKSVVSIPSHTQEKILGMGESEDGKMISMLVASGNPISLELQTYDVENKKFLTPKNYAGLVAQIRAKLTQDELDQSDMSCQVTNPPAGAKVWKPKEHEDTTLFPNTFTDEVNVRKTLSYSDPVSSSYLYNWEKDHGNEPPPGKITITPLEVQGRSAVSRVVEVKWMKADENSDPPIYQLDRTIPTTDLAIGLYVFKIEAFGKTSIIKGIRGR